MAGTKIGGAKAAVTNKEKYGADYYAKIGSVGGKNGTRERGSKKGFADGEAGRYRASVFGAIGGSISRRPSKKGVVNGQ